MHKSDNSTMSNKFIKAVSTITTLCYMGPDGGALFLQLISDPNVSKQTMTDFYHEFKEGFAHQPDLAAEIIEAFHIVRNDCLHNPEAVEFIQEQCKALLELQAAKDLITGNTPLNELLSK